MREGERGGFGSFPPQGGNGAASEFRTETCIAEGGMEIQATYWLISNLVWCHEGKTRTRHCCL